MVSVVGHDKWKNFLKSLHTSGRIPSGLLFSGKEGIGKKLLALEFAKGLLCKSDKPFGCGECKSCKQVGRFIEAIKRGETEDFEYRTEGENGKTFFAYLVGDHPDLVVVVPDGKQIKIDQIREVSEYAYLKPTGRRKVIVIDEAEKMNPQAQNALLKTLEEPPPDTLFILITSDKEKLLPTIRSRCFICEFKPLNEEDLKRVLSEFELPEGLEELILKDRSLRLLRIEKVEEFVQLWRAIRDFENTSYTEVIKASELFEKLSDGERETFLSLVERALSDRAIAELNSPKVAELVPTLVADLKRSLTRSVKPKLVFQHLAFTLKRVAEKELR